MHRGHVHDSAFFGDDYTASMVLEFGDPGHRVAGVSHSGTLHATVALGSAYKIGKRVAGTS